MGHPARGSLMPCQLVKVSVDLIETSSVREDVQVQAAIEETIARNT